ncbi:helix-turn-helix domain-containing protein [Stackebrandtia endophytica]|nr:helix-turn-helix transcriptional regulator [Stackebrandtia endophytica]
MSKASSLRAQWLGERLKKARLAAGFTLQDAAEYLQLHEGTMSRFETATYAVRRSYVRDLIDFYRVSDQRDRDALIQLCEDAWRKDWWDGQAADVEREFIDYTWLEARAARICVFEPTLVHGLLQTEHYTRALMVEANGHEMTEEQLDKHVEFRMLRKRVLNADNPTRLALIVEESVLRRPVGGWTVLKEKLRYLLKQAQLEHIEVRVLPTEKGWRPGMSEMFTYFEMPEPYSDVAFVENLAGRTYLEQEDKVAKFHRAYAGLQEVALSPAASSKLIRATIKELD